MITVLEQLGLVDGGFHLHRVEFANKQLLGHKARVGCRQPAEHGFDLAVVERTGNNFFIELFEVLMS